MAMTPWNSGRVSFVKTYVMADILKKWRVEDIWDTVFSTLNLKKNYETEAYQFGTADLVKFGRSPPFLFLMGNHFVAAYPSIQAKD